MNPLLPCHQGRLCRTAALFAFFISALATYGAPPRIGYPADESVIPQNRPTVDGYADPLSEVEVVIDGVSLGDTIADADGIWFFPTPVGLADGLHILQAKASDGSVTTSFTVDTTPPAVPLLTIPANGAAVNTTTPVIAGASEPASLVELWIDERYVGTVVAAETHVWAYFASIPLAEGSHTAFVFAYDSVGNMSAMSEVCVFTVDTERPSVPVITSPAENEEIVGNDRPIFSGTSEPGSTVAVEVDGVTLGYAVADASGNWVFTVTDALADGEHTLAAQAADPAGNPSDGEAVVVFSIKTAAPRVIGFTVPEAGVYGPGDSLEFTVTYDVPVTTHLMPSIGLRIGGQSSEASIKDGSGTNTLTFSRMIFSGDNGTGITVYSINGFIYDETRQIRAESTLPERDTSGIVIDTTPPVITSEPTATAVMGYDSCTYQFTADDPDATFVASRLPTGMTLDPITGKLTGVPGEVGTFQITGFVNDSLGNSSHLSLTLVIHERARLANISGRARVGIGDDLIVTGFVVIGNDPVPVLLRGVGPGLSNFGISDPLLDPRIDIYHGNIHIASNDDWQVDGTVGLQTVMKTLGAFDLTARDAAMILTLEPGSYTMHVSASARSEPTDMEGVALAEVYDASDTPSTGINRLVNISSRAKVADGENVVIAGFVVAGTLPKRVLVRGVGPGLSRFGVANPAPDPVVTIFKGKTEIATNDDWGLNTEAQVIVSVAKSVGAFDLNEGSSDAVLLLTLEPGVYTAHVGSADGAPGGVALAEVYEVDE